MTEKIAAIIAAAGTSSRMDGRDKIFADLGGVPVLARSVEVFENSDLIHEIVVVVHPDNLGAAEALRQKRGWRKVSAVVPGGARRQDSVSAALAALGESDWLLIHDGARPLLPPELISRGLEAARETGAAIAAVPVKDTIKLAGPDGVVVGTPPRQSLRLVQTPQVFRTDLIRRAYAANPPDVTDDAALVERIGGQVRLFDGDYVNIKITTPEDLALAALLLKKHGN
jgi:2-C-methyl-D-erythritol 4-phosphate cytidylyltransferase